VGVVVVGVGVVEDDVFDVMGGVVTTGLELDDMVVLIGVELGVVGLGIEEINVDDVGVDEGCRVEEAGAAGGSSMASTQYDFPTTRPPQSAVMDGF
jgi:hypothetical protein